MLRRDRVRAERARPLSRPHRCVDPALGEEPLGDVRELRRERCVRVEHELASLVPPELGVSRRDGRHPVVVGEPVEPEQLRLERVPALGDVVAALHRVDEGLDRLVARLVGEVAARDPPGEGAQPVVGGLVREQRVEHERPGAQSRCEPCGHRGGRALAHRAVRRCEQRQALFEPDGLAVEVDRDRGRQLVEQARPRARTGDVLLREDLLFRLGEQMRAVAPRGAEVVAYEREPVVGEQLVHPLVRQRGPLQLEEEHPRVDRGAALLDPLHERAELGIRRVHREAQAGVRPGLADQLGERRHLLHDLGQARGVELHDGAAPGLDARGQRVGRVERRIDAGDAPAVDQRLEIPCDVGRGEVGVLRCRHGLERRA